MKILVTNHWLKKPGGSETFTYTLIKTLKEFGHEVDLFTNIPGMVSNHISRELGVDIPIVLQDSYDLILANHKTTVEHCRKFTHGPIIQTCHGTIPKLEQPSVLATAHVGISNEVVNYLKSKDFKSKLIVNGIDCKRFAPVTTPNKKIKQVLSLSHSEELNHLLASKLAKYNVGLITINKYTNPVWHIEKLMQESDLVISLGRGAYEAMACGCAVLILDYRPYMNKILGDGIITRYNFFDYQWNNCSGRTRMRNNITEMLEEAFDEYSVEMCEYNRHLAVNNLNIIEKTHEYISVLPGLKNVG